MNRKLRALGLTLVAAFAMSALAVASASAAEFHSNGSPTEIKAASEGNQVFVATSTVTCETGAFIGEQVGEEADTVTVHPTYSECSSSFGGNPTTVTTTGCDYIFDSDIEGSHASVDLECEAGKAIIIDNSLCTIHITTQTDIGQGVTYTNLNSEKEVTVAATATSIDISKKEGSLCFLVGSTGTYTGNAIVKGFEPGTANQRNVWVT